MSKWMRFFYELSVTDATPLVYAIITMIMAFGLLVCGKLYAASLPYHYTVQCKAPSNPRSRIVLSSRVSGLTSEGPAADAKGLAEVTSENDSGHYEITLEGSTCRRVEPSRQ